MIFVTVGTHEQPFNRLVECVDNLKRDGMIEEEVVIQTGYSTVEPKYCDWKKFYSYQEMISLVEKARIVITHGGPSSFILPLQIGKTPIVVPRKAEFNEHVNNHQVTFANAVAERMGNIYVVENVEELGEVITKYSENIGEMIADINSNNEMFNAKFADIVNKMFE